MKSKLQMKTQVLEYVFLICVLISMGIYQWLKNVIKGEKMSTEVKLEGYALTCVYSFFIIVFGTAYKKLIAYIVEKTNHQY